MLRFSIDYTYSILLLFFFFNDPATTEIYTLFLHDALPISFSGVNLIAFVSRFEITCCRRMGSKRAAPSVRSISRSEEHTSELQSQFHLVCRLLLEKKKKKTKLNTLRALTIPTPHVSIRNTT